MIGIETIFLEKNKEGNWGSSQNPNRAAFFGDGIFETMRFENSHIRFHDKHARRVSKGLEALKIDPGSVSTLDEIASTLRHRVTEVRSWRIRWNIYRAGLGKYTPLSNRASESLLIQPFTPSTKVKESAYISQTIQLHYSPWSHCKTLNALPYVMANIERQEAGMDEVLLTDDQGFLSEAGASNIFWVIDGDYYTPSLKHHAIAGVARQEIIDHLDKSGISVHIGSFKPEILNEAMHLFTSNVMGISYIATWGNNRYDTTPIPVIEELFL